MNNQLNDKTRVENLQVMLSFKIKKCRKENCLKSENWIGQKKKCHRYHTDKDKRRFPFIMPVSILQNQKNLMEKLKNHINYRLIDLFEELIEFNPDVFTFSKIHLSYYNIFSDLFENDKNNCLNDVEYLYHPSNYKSKKCELGSNCDFQFCYDYHNKEEFLEFEDLRELFLQTQDCIFSRYNRLNIDMIGSIEKLEYRKKLYLKHKFPFSELEEQLKEEELKKKENFEIEKFLDINTNEISLNGAENLNNDVRNLNKYLISENNNYMNYQQNQQGYHQNINNLNPNPQNSEFFLKNETNNYLNYNQNNVNSNPQQNYKDIKLNSNENYEFFTNLKNNYEIISKEMVEKDLIKNNIVSSRNSPERQRTYSIKSEKKSPSLSPKKKKSPNQKKKTTKRQTVKKGKFLCKYNEENSNEFVYNKEVEMYESITNEFKHFTKIDITTILNYICGYLNSYGGSLYFGINDDGIVKGIQMSRKEIDDFQINLDIALRNFMPKVFPDQIRVKFNEICLDDKASFVILDRYVLQIDIFCINHNEIYITNDYNCYIKKHASLNHLSIDEIIKLVKSRYNPFISSDNLPSRLNPLILERMSTDELKAVVKNMGAFLKMAEDKMKFAENK